MTQTEFQIAEKLYSRTEKVVERHVCSRRSGASENYDAENDNNTDSSRMNLSKSDLMGMPNATSGTGKKTSQENVNDYRHVMYIDNAVVVGTEIVVKDASNKNTDVHARL